jgi:tetratricopeptide (TPR) repeat protein
VINGGNVILSRAILISTVFIFFGCAASSGGMNEIPEYGHLEKTSDLKEADQKFIRMAREQYGDSASYIYAQYGWNCIRNRQARVAIRRFNQSWLLDSTNYKPYWGFAVALGKLGKYEESIHYYEIALKKGGDEKIIIPEYALALWEYSLRSSNSVQKKKAEELLNGEINKGNDKASCIYAYALTLERRNGDACRAIKKCPDDLDGISAKLKCQ